MQPAQHPPQPPSVPVGEIDLLDVANVLVKGWPKIVASGLLAGVVAALLAFSMPDVYRARVVLAPAEASDASGGLLAQASGLANLAGLSVGLEQPVDKTALALEILKSRQFFGEFAERRSILVPLFATESWEPETGDIVVDTDVYDPGAEEWRRSVDGRGVAKPTLLEAHERFEKLMEIETERDTGFVTVSIEHASPNVAHDWLTWIIEDLNERVRSKDIREAERSIAYLSEQVEQTGVSDLRSGFFQLIQSQTETMMLARVREEYVFQIIDPSIVPERKSGPQRVVMCIAGGMLGGFLGIAWVLVGNAVRPRSD